MGKLLLCLMVVICFPITLLGIIGKIIQVAYVFGGEIMLGVIKECRK